MRPLVFLLALGVCVCCVTPVRVGTLPEAGGRSIRKIALVTFSLGTPLTSQAQAVFFAERAAAQVTGKVFEALERRAVFELVPPGEAELALLGGGPLGVPSQAGDVGRRLQQVFSVDAVLFGILRRYAPRQGGEHGTLQPAAVCFELELRATDGTLLWWGIYDERQQSVSENAGTFGLAMSRRFRWLTAQALARYGAEELAGRLSEASQAWR